MSDRSEDITRSYKRYVEKKTDEDEEPPGYNRELVPARGGMWSVALETLLTTLRLLAPATLLTLFWGHQSFFAKLFNQVETAVKSVIFSSNNQNEAALTWLLDYITPVMPQSLTKSNSSVLSLQQVWHQGLLCRALERAVPGTCGTCERDHGMAHAQIVAQQYLRVEPVFSSSELESINVLTKFDEIKFTQYLMSVRTAIQRLSPPVSKPGSPSIGHEIRTYTLDYVARGMGLIQTRNNKKAIFRIYPTAQQRFDPGNISILIRGPQDLHGSVTVPAVYARNHFLQNVLLGIEEKSKLLPISLPLTQGTAYMRSHGKTDINKAFYIPKIKQDIDISVSINNNHVKVTYITKIEGRYEISLISKGCNIVGSPFTVESLKTSLDELAIGECDDYESDTESVDSNSDRKVVFRIVDFVTEKMLLHDNGTLEKISDIKANELMSKAKLLEKSLEKPSKIEEPLTSNEPDLIETENTTKKEHQASRFKDISKKILFMVKICQRFRDLIKKIAVEGLYDLNTSSQKIPILNTPDIVNSTRSQSNSPSKCSTQNTMVEADDIYDSPLLHSSYTDSLSSTYSELNKKIFYSYDTNDPDVDLEADLLPKIHVTDIEKNEIIHNNYSDSTFKCNNLLERPKTPTLHILPHELISKIGSFAEEDDFILDCETPTSENNPQQNVTESVNPVLFEDIFYNESPNFNYVVGPEIQSPVADFLIGAPVSLPPLLKAPSPEPMNTRLQQNLDRDSYEVNSGIQKHVDLSQTVDSETSSLFATTLLKSDDLSCSLKRCQQSSESEDSSSDVFFTSAHSEEIIERVQRLDCVEHTEDSNYEQSISPYEIFVENQLTDNFPRNDIWDSAYVSIDENNSSPDTMSNKSDNTLPTSNNVKNKTLLIADTKRNNFVMGRTVDREICRASTKTIMEKDKFEITNQFTTRTTPLYLQGRTTFIPIDEENDSYSDTSHDIFKNSNESRNDTKFTEKQQTFFKDENLAHETESVSAAFSELSDVFNQYLPNCSKTNSPTCIQDRECCNSLDISSTIFVEKNGEGATVVNSASDKETDVKRRNCNTDVSGDMKLISEVQTFAAESYSASRQHIMSNDDTNILASENSLQKKNEMYNSTKSAESSQIKNNTIFSENSKTINLVTEKRKYWDEKIKNIEESIEIVPFIKKKLSSKCLRKNDSLGKKRGKNIATTSNCKFQPSINNNMDMGNTVNSKTDLNSMFEKGIAEVNLVKKWKRFWDEKVESITIDGEKNTINSACKTKRKKLSDKVQTIGLTNALLKASKNSIIITENKSKNVSTVENSTKYLCNKTCDSAILEANKNISNYKYPIVARTKHILPLEKVTVSAPLMTSLPALVNESQTANKSELRKTDVQDKLQTFNNIELTPIKKININNYSSSYKKANFVNESIKDDEDDDLKAFETSPKRFFGKSTSMKNIKQRIDNLLGSSDCSATKTEVTTSPVMGLVANRIITFGDRCKSLESIYNKTMTENSKFVTNKHDSVLNHISDNTENIRNYKSYSMLNLKKNKSMDEKQYICNVITDKASPTESKTNGRIVEITDDVLKVNNQYSSEESPPKRIYIKQVILMFNKGERDEKYEYSNIQLKNKGILEDNCNIEHASVCSAEIKARSSNSDLHKFKDDTVIENNSTLDSTDRRNITDDPKPHDTTTLKTYCNLLPDESDFKSQDVEEKGSTTSSLPGGDLEYKQRFNNAKSFFQSLDNLDIKMSLSKGQLNECEQLLYKSDARNIKIPGKSTGKGGLGKFRSKSLRKLPTQTYSAPTSDSEFDTTSLYDQWEERNVGAGGRKLIKISERFQVEGLFRDVVGDGNLRRKGSFRGIPHTQAVLAAFRSMENLAGRQMSVSTMNLQKNIVAQSHHVDYPYLPTTKPSKCRSRKDAKTYGLISRKELLRKAAKPRRNSAPDGCVWNENFTAKL